MIHIIRQPNLSGHRGGGHGKPPHWIMGSCSVTPNPLQQWAVGTLSGSGFPINSTVSFTIQSPTGGLAVGGDNTDAQGNFETQIQGWVGTNLVTVFKDNVIATCSFEVVVDI